MLEALLGFWIGTTTLTFTSVGIYAIGGSSFLDEFLFHGGRWSIIENTIEFVPEDQTHLRPVEQALLPRGPFRCTYVLNDRKLVLSGCPYKGIYFRHEPRAKRLP
jgi:hypothetical protein